MAAGIAHELNNPLITVTGFIELVLEDIPEDAPPRTDMEMVLREVHRARDVVGQLLDFVRQGERVHTSGVHSCLTVVLVDIKHRHFCHFWLDMTD